MTDNFDKTRGAGEQTGNSKQYLTFTVMDEEYGVDIMTVREIKGWTETTRLPNSPEFMRGVMNLRGIIIPIFDLRARFTKDLTQANEKNVIIILAVNERNVGILVDTVSDILTVNANDVKPAPELENKIDSDFINGLISINERMVVLLAVEKLFNTELAQVKESIQQQAI